MRVAVMVGCLGAMLAACSGKPSDQKLEQSAAVQNYVPPSVTSRLDYGSLTERRFRRLDRNQDDAITRDELPTTNPGRIASLDANHDGRVTEEEFSKGQLARFDANDLNHDGTVTSAERQLKK